MLALELLRVDHAAAVLDFETVNREYFATSIPDRGDDFFTEFDDRFAALLAEQDVGTCRFHVLVDDGSILGRFNLIDLSAGSADLGYRVARSAAGRGLATAAVRRLCVLAAEQYGLNRLTAGATVDNIASRTVLTRNGFVPDGDTVLNGRPAHRYRRDLDGSAPNPKAAQPLS